MFATEPVVGRCPKKIKTFLTTVMIKHLFPLKANGRKSEDVLKKLKHFSLTAVRIKQLALKENGRN